MVAANIFFVSRDAAAAIPSQPVNMNTLFSRLDSLVVNPDGFVDRGPPQSPPESVEGTPLPIMNEMDFEAASYHELRKSGGRAVCSIQALLHTLADPAAKYDVLLPWLSDPDSASRDAEVRTVFSRQLERWWDFQKWQWGNRGVPGGDDGFSVFLEAQRGMCERMEAHREMDDPYFEETMRRLWQQKADLRQLGEDQGFTTYNAAVKRRLAPHSFSWPLQLRKDPRQQTEWTTWLEYLNYEQWWFEQYTSALEAKEPRYNQAWKKLLEAARPVPNGVVDFTGTSKSRKRHKNTEFIDDFIRETTPYRRAEAIARRQRARVQWVLSEARSMEFEMSKQGSTKSNAKQDIGDGMKRSRDDDDQDQDIERRSKRTKKGHGGDDAALDTIAAGPRRSKRLRSQTASSTRR